MGVRHTPLMKTATVNLAVDLAHIDPTITHAIEQERLRIDTEINLIASENYVSIPVLQALGSVLTNKYAEGYPHKRYYGGCQWVDSIENTARTRAQELFGADHANVQPHAGSQANMAAYSALLKPGATIMGMNLAHGGHLTHGHPLSFSGQNYKIISYGVDPDTERIDYSQIHTLAETHKPQLIIAGASAYSRIIDFEKFATIAQATGALLLVDMAHIAGLVAAKVHPSPVPFADIVTSTTHKTLRGPRGGLILCKSSYANAVDKAVFPGTQGGPLMHSIGAKAVSFLLAQRPDFVEYQKQVLLNARTLAEEFSALNYRIVSGGTDTHLLTLDLRSQNITGKEAEEILGSIGITCNRNTIPNDPQKPFITSGIRIGSPAITTRGFTTVETRNLVHLMHDALKNRHNIQLHQKLKKHILELAHTFPIYAHSLPEGYIPCTGAK